MEILKRLLKRRHQRERSSRDEYLALVSTLAVAGEDVPGGAAEIERVLAEAGRDLREFEEDVAREQERIHLVDVVSGKPALMRAFRDACDKETAAKAKREKSFAEEQQRVETATGIKNRLQRELNVLNDAENALRHLSPERDEIQEQERILGRLKREDKDLARLLRNAEGQLRVTEQRATAQPDNDDARRSHRRAEEELKRLEGRREAIPQEREAAGERLRKLREQVGLVEA